MNYLLLLISVASLINLINTHGLVNSPRPRSGKDTAQGCWFFQNMYLNSFKCDNACGNPSRHDLQTGEVDVNSEKTGPVVETYLSGQTIVVNVSTIVHAGYQRIRLCKLKSPTDIVTQACLDENLLEIRDKDSENLNMDKYTVRKKGANDFNVPPQIILAKLPDGLDCNNCVLQWEWTSNDECTFQNGTNVPQRVWCLGQTYKNCMDIRINPNPTLPSTVYKRNLAINHPVMLNNAPLYSPSRAKVYSFESIFGMKKDASGKQIRNTNPDPLQFIGDGLRCFLDEAIAKSMGDKAVADLKKNCRDNCMTSDKKCPDACFCRWFKVRTY